jgi:hypothetical protein
MAALNCILNYRNTSIAAAKGLHKELISAERSRSFRAEHLLPAKENLRPDAAFFPQHGLD